MAVAKVLGKHGRVLDLFYVSNCEQYFDFPENYRANILAQPSNEKALVLRSRPWREFLPGTRDPKGPIRYTFTYQPLRTFQQWMQHPKVTRLYDMISRDRIVGKAVSFTKAPPQQ